MASYTLYCFFGLLLCFNPFFIYAHTSDPAEVAKLRVDDIHFFQSDLNEEEESAEKSPFPSLQTLILTGAEQPSSFLAGQDIAAFGLEIPGGFYNLKQELLSFLNQPLTAEVIEQIQSRIVAYYQQFPSYSASATLLSQDLATGTLQFAVQVHFQPALQEEPLCPPTIQALVLLSKGNFLKKEASGIEMIGLEIPAGSYNLEQRLKPYLGEPLTEANLTLLQQEIYAYYAFLNAPLHQVYVVSQEEKTGLVQIELDTPLSFVCKPVIEAIALLNPTYSCPLDGVEGIVTGDIEIPGGSYNLEQRLKAYLEAPYEPQIFRQIQETVQDYYLLFFLQAELHLLPPDPQTGIVCFSLRETPLSPAEIEALIEQENSSSFSAPQIQAIVLSDVDHPCAPTHVEGIVAFGLEIPGDLYNLKQHLLPFLQAPHTPEEIEQIQAAIVNYYRSFPHYDAVVSLLSQDLQTGTIQFAVHVHSPYPKEEIQPTLQSLVLLAKGRHPRKKAGSLEIWGLEIPAGSYNLEQVLKPYLHRPLDDALIQQLQAEIQSYYAQLEAPLTALHLLECNQELGRVQIELDTPLAYSCTPLIQAILLLSPDSSCHFEEIEGIVPVSLEIPGGSYNLTQRLTPFLEAPFSQEILQEIQQTIREYYAYFRLQAETKQVQVDPENGILSFSIQAEPEPEEPAPRVYPPLHSIVLSKPHHTCQPPNQTGLIILGLEIPGGWYNLDIRLRPFFQKPMNPETLLLLQKTVAAYYEQLQAPFSAITLAHQTLQNGQVCFTIDTPLTLPCPSDIHTIVLKGDATCVPPEEAEGIVFIHLEVPAGSYNLQKRLEPYLLQSLSPPVLEQITREIRLYYALFPPLRAQVTVQKEDVGQGLVELWIQTQSTECLKCTPQRVP